MTTYRATVGVTTPQAGKSSVLQLVEVGRTLKARLAPHSRGPERDALSDVFQGHRVGAARLASALSTREITVLADAHVLQFDGDILTSPFRAHVIEDFLIFTDPAVPTNQQAPTYLDPLWEAGHLSRVLVRGRAASALDMGCGCGALSLILSSIADHVVGVDLNPRAVAVSAFNAALNGVRNVEFINGDLFSPVGASRFERIVFNSPTAGGGDRYVSLLQAGEGILRRFLEAVPEHLAPNGYCQMNLALQDDDETPASRKIARWLGVEAPRYQLLLLTLSRVTVDGGGTLRRGWLSIRHGAGGMTEMSFDYARLVSDPLEGSAMIVAAMDSASGDHRS